MKTIVVESNLKFTKNTIHNIYTEKIEIFEIVHKIYNKRLNKKLIIYTLFFFFYLISLVSASLEWNKKESITLIWKSVGGNVTKIYGYNFRGMPLIDSSMKVGDFIAFSKTYRIRPGWDYSTGCHKFQGLEFTISQALNASGYTYVWEYYDYGSGWKPLPNVTDATNGFQNTGTNSVTWDMPTTWRMAYKLFNNDVWASGAFVRIRITGLNSITKNAVQDFNTYIKDYSYAVWIDDGNTYTPQDIYNFMVSQGKSSLVSKSKDGKKILLNANLIINNGTLHIYDHTSFTIGKTPGSDGEWYSIEITDNVAEPTLQLGYLDKNGRGYRGGELIWNNGWDKGHYLYWSGKVLCYGSRIWLYGYGEYGLTNGGYVEIVDSIWTRGKNYDKWYFAQTSSGLVERSSIQSHSIYIYSGKWSFDVLSLAAGEQGGIRGIVDGGAYHTVKVTNTNFANLSASVCQRASMALIDCYNVDDSRLESWGDYSSIMSITKRFSFKIKVTDKDGNPIQGAKVYLRDKYGRTAFKQDLYEQENCYITGLDKNTSDITGYMYNRPSQLNVGDYIWVRGEIMKILSLPPIGTNGTFTCTRMENGSLVLGSHQMEDVYKIINYETTDINGEVKYTGSAGDMNYLVVTDEWYRVSGINGEEHYNPFTITISHPDYPLREYTFTLDKKIDWTIPLGDRPQNFGMINVYGTEYAPGEEGVIYVQVLYGNGSPASDATCNITIFNKNTTWVSEQNLTYMHGSDGSYYYNFTVPSDISVFMANVKCSNPTAYGSSDFHVSTWAKDITQGLKLYTHTGSFYSPSDKIDIYATTTNNQGALINTTINVEIFYPNGTSLNSGQLSYYETGRANYTFTLPSNAPTGTYRVEIDSNYSHYYAHETITFLVSPVLEDISDVVDYINTTITNTITSYLQEINQTTHTTYSYLTNTITPQLDRIEENVSYIRDNMATASALSSLQSDVTWLIDNVATQENITMLEGKIDTIYSNVDTLITRTDCSNPANSVLCAYLENINSTVTNIKNNLGNYTTDDIITRLNEINTTTKNTYSYLQNEIITRLNEINTTTQNSYINTQSLLSKWGTYTAQQIYNISNATYYKTIEIYNDMATASALSSLQSDVTWLIDNVATQENVSLFNQKLDTINSTINAIKTQTDCSNESLNNSSSPNYALCSYLYNINSTINTIYCEMATKENISAILSDTEWLINNVATQENMTEIISKLKFINDTVNSISSNLTYVNTSLQTKLEDIQDDVDWLVDNIATQENMTEITTKLTEINFTTNEIDSYLNNDITNRLTEINTTTQNNYNYLQETIYIKLNETYNNTQQTLSYIGSPNDDESKNTLFGEHVYTQNRLVEINSNLSHLRNLTEHINITAEEINSTVSTILLEVDDLEELHQCSISPNSTICTLLNNIKTDTQNIYTLSLVINETTQDINQSISSDFHIRLSDFGEIAAGSDFLLKVWIVNYLQQPKDADSNPTVTLYDPLRNAIGPFTMTKEETGIYSFNFTTTSSMADGTWEAVVTTVVNGITNKYNDYWELKSSPAEVKVNSIIDKTIPTITADVTITNEGTGAEEYQYEYCIVKDQSNMCGGGDDECYGSGAKLIQPGQSWNTQFTCDRISQPGDYWFKILVYYGTDVSGASKSFTAVESTSLGDAVEEAPSIPINITQKIQEHQQYYNQKNGFSSVTINVTHEEEIPEKNIKKRIGEIRILDYPEFIDLKLNETVAEKVIVKNIGNDNLHDVKLIISGMPLHLYLISPKVIPSIPPGETAVFTIRFKPSLEEAQYPIKLIITSDEDRKQEFSVVHISKVHIKKQASPLIELEQQTLILIGLVVVFLAMFVFVLWRERNLKLDLEKIRKDVFAKRIGEDIDKELSKIKEHLQDLEAMYRDEVIDKKSYNKAKEKLNKKLEKLVGELKNSYGVKDNKREIHKKLRRKRHK